MNKFIVLLILLAAVLITAGCIEDTNSGDDTNSPKVGNNSADIQEAQKEGTVTNITQLEEINTSLQNGPVLVKIGAEWCGPCQAMKPILKDLATEYDGKITVASIDIDQSPELAAYFDIGYIPDTSLIVSIENGEYVYMKEDGSVSKDRLQARILGQMEEEQYKKLIDLALLQKGEGSS